MKNSFLYIEKLSNRYVEIRLYLIYLLIGTFDILRLFGIDITGYTFGISGVNSTIDEAEEHFIRPEKKVRTYRMATKSYLMHGKDGYDDLAHANVLIDEEEGPQLTYAVQNHFKALAMREGRTRRTSVHHQSLVSISRR